MHNLSRYNYYLRTITDLLAVSVSFFLGYLIRFRTALELSGPLASKYQGLFLLIVIGYLIVNFLTLGNEKNVNRALADDIRSVFTADLQLSFLLVLYLFFSKTGAYYSRWFIAWFIVLFFLFAVLFRRILNNQVFPILENSKNAEKMVLIGRKNQVEKYVERIRDSKDWRLQIAGLVIVDEKLKGEYVLQLPVIANQSDMLDVLRTFEADSVMLAVESLDDNSAELVKKITNLGKVTRVTTSNYDILNGVSRSFDFVGGSDVLSFQPIREMSRRQVALKRFCDILISLLLLPITLLVGLLTIVFNTLESPGPVLTRIVRVGKNGRRFYQYRYRTLRMDADERIKEGKSPFTIWGSLMNKIYFDRFALLFNVLFSDMSFVGPHAPTLQRFLEYGPERRKNLCIRPGIIGKWCFEEEEVDIIAQERGYIEKWGIFQDILIIFELVIRYFAHRLPRSFDDSNLKEACDSVNDEVALKRPLEYELNYEADAKPVYLLIKRLLDILLSLAAIIVLSPLLLILAIVVTAGDGGSPIYGHERIGYHGKRIKVYKFRSMRLDAGDLKKLLTPEQLEQYRTEFKIDNDPRITRWGNFLRKTSLDELPQLFNILKGDLSIVGPRPIVESETKIYGDEIAKLLSVKPGLTGYWQAYARNNATYESGERQAMEMYYVDHRSLWMDIKIIFKTVATVIPGEGAK